MERPSVLNAMRAVGYAVGVSLIGGCLIGVVLGSWIAGLNEIPSFAETAVLVGYLSLLYVAASLPAIVGLAFPLGLFGARPGWRLCTAIFVSWYIVVNASTRFISSVQFISVFPHMSLIGLLDVVVILTTAVAAGWMINAKRSVVGIGIAVALLGGLHLLHHIHEAPRQLELDEWVAEAKSGEPGKSIFGTGPVEEQFKNAQVAVFAVDGLGWEVLIPLLKSGDCPNFKTLLAGGAAGHLATNPYTRSPALWESIATGKDPLEHGIADHFHYVFPGIEKRIGHFPRFPMSNSLFGVNRLLERTLKWGLWSRELSNAMEARSARFWEIAERAGHTAGMYKWYNTTPAAPVRGFTVGGGHTEPRNYPVDLEADMELLVGSSIKVGMLGWIEAEIPTENEHFRRFVSHAMKYEPSVLGYYTHFADSVNHLNWNDAAHSGKFFIGGLRDIDLDPGPAITNLMRFIDGQLGEYMRRLPEDATLVVVADHGFDFRGYEHDNAPPGVLIMRGPEIQPGIMTGARLVDVAPTLLHLLGLPAAEDMQGRPLEVARRGSELDRKPVFVASHGPANEPIDIEQIGTDGASEHEEYLRALGYVE